MGFLDPVRGVEVHNATTLCNWASAKYGVPPPTQKDIKILNKKARDLFESVPGTDWQTIVEVIKWCHQRKRRYGRIWSYLAQYRFAWAAGAITLPEVDGLNDRINAAIAVETNPAWRSRLRRAAGEHREEVLSEWELSRKVSTT